ncbi:hypothetical protein ACOME3_010641 [Neoechinorhynchus agilis]
MSSLSIRKTNKKSTLKHKNEFKLNEKIVRRRLLVERRFIVPKSNFSLSPSNLKMIALLCFTAFISIGFSSGNQKRQESTLPEQRRRGGLFGQMDVHYYTESDTETDSNYTEIQEVINAFNKGHCVDLVKDQNKSKAGGVEIYVSGMHIYKEYELKQYEKSRFQEFFDYGKDLFEDRCVDVEYYVDPDSKTDKNYTDIKKIVAGNDKYKQHVHAEKRDNKSKAGKVHIARYAEQKEITNGSAEFPYEESKFKSALNGHINSLEKEKKKELEQAQSAPRPLY